MYQSQLKKTPQGYLFRENALLCLIKPGAPGITCGYVRLYNDHPLVGRTDLYDQELKALKLPILSSGITFAGPMEEIGQGWWLGFFVPGYTRNDSLPYRREVDEEIVHDGCLSLVHQLLPKDMTEGELPRWVDEAEAVRCAGTMPYYEAPLLIWSTPMYRDEDKDYVRRKFFDKKDTP